MLQLEIRCGYSQVPVLQSVKVSPSSSTSPVKLPSPSEGGVEVPVNEGLCHIAPPNFSLESI